MAVLFTCPVCKQNYSTLEEAVACKNTFIDFCGLEVGSIVIVPGKRLFHKDDVDPIWLAFTIPADPDSESHFDHCETYVPYMVVTGLHLERKSHKPLVTLWLPRPADRRSEHYADKHDYGWNPANGHGHKAMLKPGEPLVRQNCTKGSYWAEWLDKQVMAATPSEALRYAAASVEPRISTYLL